MKAAKKFNGLNGTVITRKGIERLIELAKQENETEIIYRLSTVLNDQPKGKKFKIILEQYPEPGLNAARHSGIYKEALDSCGRLNPGYQFKDGSIVKIAKRKVRKPAPKPISKTLKKVVNKQPVEKVPEKEANPVSFANKPKSVSVATAIQDVLGTGNYPVKPLQANVLYTALKDTEDLTADEIQLNSSPFQTGILNTIPEELGWYYESDDQITLYDKGVKLVSAIRGRLDSLRNQKHNYALFDGLKGAKSSKNSNGLNAPVFELPAPATNSDPVEEITEEELITESAPIVKSERKRNPLVSAITDDNDTPSEYFTVTGEVGKFLQRVERKPVHSVVITMDGQQGAGKTTTLYKFMDAFATPGNKCLFISGEEHPRSDLAKKKRNDYLSPAAQQNIDTVAEVKDAQQLYELVADYEVIFIDSWQKLVRMVGAIKLDEDLRKRFDGKVFVIIFQQTTEGRTKGGAEVVFDGDIIIKMVKEGRFIDNYAYFDKNRYTVVPLETIYFNIANGVVYNPEGEAEPEPAEEKSTISTKLNFTVV